MTSLKRIDIEIDKLESLRKSKTNPTSGRSNNSKNSSNINSTNSYGNGVNTKPPNRKPVEEISRVILRKQCDDIIPAPPDIFLNPSAPAFIPKSMTPENSLPLHVEPADIDRRLEELLIEKCRILGTLLIDNPDESLKKNYHLHLWGIFRDKYNKAKASKDSIALEAFLMDSIQFYRQQLNASDNEKKYPRVRAEYLIRLGDLHRYFMGCLTERAKRREGVKVITDDNGYILIDNNGSLKSADQVIGDISIKAIDFYRRASVLVPSSDLPHNQISLVYGLPFTRLPQGSRVEALPDSSLTIQSQSSSMKWRERLLLLYHFYRALACPEGTIVRGNLESKFGSECERLHLWRKSRMEILCARDEHESRHAPSSSSRGNRGRGGYKTRGSKRGLSHIAGRTLYNPNDSAVNTSHDNSLNTNQECTPLWYPDNIPRPDPASQLIAGLYRLHACLFTFTNLDLVKLVVDEILTEAIPGCMVLGCVSAWEWCMIVVLNSVSCHCLNKAPPVPDDTNTSNNASKITLVKFLAVTFSMNFIAKILSSAVNVCSQDGGARVMTMVPSTVFIMQWLRSCVNPEDGILLSKGLSPDGKHDDERQVRENMWASLARFITVALRYYSQYQCNPKEMSLLDHAILDANNLCEDVELYRVPLVLSISGGVGGDELATFPKVSKSADFQKERLLRIRHLALLFCDEDEWSRFLDNQIYKNVEIMKPLLYVQNDNRTIFGCHGVTIDDDLYMDNDYDGNGREWIPSDDAYTSGLGSTSTGVVVSPTLVAPGDLVTNSFNRNQGIGSGANGIVSAIGSIHIVKPTETQFQLSPMLMAGMNCYASSDNDEEETIFFRGLGDSATSWAPRRVPLAPIGSCRPARSGSDDDSATGDGDAGRRSVSPPGHYNPTTDGLSLFGSLLPANDIPFINKTDGTAWMVNDRHNENESSDDCGDPDAFDSLCGDIELERSRHDAFDGAGARVPINPDYVTMDIRHLKNCNNNDSNNNGIHVNDTTKANGVCGGELFNPFPNAAYVQLGKSQNTSYPSYR